MTLTWRRSISWQGRAELRALVALVLEIKIKIKIKNGLAAAPTTIHAIIEISAQGARAVGLSTELAATLQMRMTVAMGSKKSELAGLLAEVAQLKANIQGLLAMRAAYQRGWRGDPRWGR